jgi:hypothetical protein
LEEELMTKEEIERHKEWNEMRRKRVESLRVSPEEIEWNIANRERQSILANRIIKNILGM